MAEQDDLDIGIDREPIPKKKLIILIGAASLLLIVIAVAAWLLLSGGAEEQGGDAEVEVPAGPMSYHKLASVFVANLQGNPRMLQVGLELRLHDPETGDFLTHHDPALRDGILDLLSIQDGQALKTRDGKDQLRAAIRDRINELIERYEGPGKVAEVLFSSFVMQ